MSYNRCLESGTYWKSWKIFPAVKMRTMMINLIEPAMIIIKRSLRIWRNRPQKANGCLFEGNCIDIDMERSWFQLMRKESTKNYLLGQYLNNTTLSSRQFISIVEKTAPLGLLAPSGALIAILTYYWSTTHPTFSDTHPSSLLDFHFLSHYSYIKGNHWTHLLATCIPYGYNGTSLQDSPR